LEAATVTLAIARCTVAGVGAVAAICPRWRYVTVVGAGRINYNRFRGQCAYQAVTPYVVIAFSTGPGIDLEPTAVSFTNPALTVTVDVAIAAIAAWQSRVAVVGASRINYNPFRGQCACQAVTPYIAIAFGTGPGIGLEPTTVSFTNPALTVTVGVAIAAIHGRWTSTAKIGPRGIIHDTVSRPGAGNAVAEI
jgi:hypothetical protein